MNLEQFRVGIFRNSDKVIINIIALPVADELFTLIHMVTEKLFGIRLKIDRD